MPPEESVHIQDLQLAKFFHDLLLSYMHFTMGIVPHSRLKQITSYLNETMYHFMDFKLLGLIEFNDPGRTLENYRGFLKNNNLVEQLVITSTKERNCTTWRLKAIKCIFGNSCRKLRSELFICPAALFGGFLAQESCSGCVRVDMSTHTFMGCDTVIRLWGGPINPKKIMLAA